MNTSRNDVAGTLEKDFQIIKKLPVDYVNKTAGLSNMMKDKEFDAKKGELIEKAEN